MMNMKTIPLDTGSVERLATLQSPRKTVVFQRDPVARRSSHDLIIALTA